MNIGDVMDLHPSHQLLNSIGCVKKEVNQELFERVYRKIEELDKETE